MAEWSEHWARDPKVGGSIPDGGGDNLSDRVGGDGLAESVVSVWRKVSAVLAESAGMVVGK